MTLAELKEIEEALCFNADMTVPVENMRRVMDLVEAQLGRGFSGEEWQEIAEYCAETWKARSEVAEQLASKALEKAARP
jgi:hypothetical protein